MNLEFYIRDVDNFFLKKCMVGDLINVLHGRRKKKEKSPFFFFYMKDQRVFLLHHPSLVQGWGRLFMIHCWYTMSMMFSNGWRGTESTLLRHLFCKTGGMDGREWVRVTGGFTRRTPVLNIWKSSCSFFFFFFL